MAPVETMMSGAEVRDGTQVVDPENLKGRLYSTLLERGVIDNLKTQLRTEILRQLRTADPSILESSAPPAPPKLPQRILNSLFIDYLVTQGYVYTLSVFTPECGMASQVPFTRAELLHLLHLRDPDLVLSRMVSPDSGRSLAWELLESLDQLRGCSYTMENGTQTKDGQGADFMESHLRSIEDSYMKRMDTEKLLPYQSLEDRMEQYRREVDRRARAEIAAAVERVRQFEVGAARMEEATRYRRQLEDAREDLERVHAERLEQLRCRDDSQRERMQRREKELEAVAYEHRQKILKETETLKEREGKLKQLEELQLRTLNLHEERLLEKEAALKQREEEMQRYRALVLAEAEEHAKLRRRDVEQEYATLLSNAKKDRELLEVERARFAEERTAFADELTFARGSKAQLRQLERQLLAAQAQAESDVETIKDLAERLTKSADEKKAMRTRLVMQGAAEPDGYWAFNGLSPGVRVCQHEPVIEQLQAQRAADRRAKKRAQQETAEAQERFQKQALQLRTLQEQQLEWRLVERKLQATVARLQAQAKEAAESEERATQLLEEVTLRLNAAEREAADVRCLYRETKAALEADEVIRREHVPTDLLSAPPPQPPKPPKVYPLAAAQMHVSGSAPNGSETVRFPDQISDPKVPLIGPQTAAFSSALQRLNELQREEQHMQHALDDFRSRSRARRAQGARAVERAAHMPASFLKKQREAKSESTSDGEASATWRSGRSADRLELLEESSGSSGKNEQLLEGKQCSTRKERESVGEDEKQAAASAQTDMRAERDGERSESILEEAKSTAEEYRSHETVDTRAALQSEEREEARSAVVPVEAQGRHDLLQTENASIRREPEAREERGDEHVSARKASSRDEQEGVLAEAASEDDEEVRSPDSVKTHTAWKEANEQIRAELPPVKTATAKQGATGKEEVKSPDTVKVLVRRREKGLPDVEEAALGQTEDFSGPRMNTQEEMAPSAPEIEAAPSKRLGATPNPQQTPVQSSKADPQPEDAMQEFNDSKEPKRDLRRNRSSVASVEARVLEEVAQLAQREVPNAESRSTTPRDKAPGETAETRIEALQSAVLEAYDPIQKATVDAEVHSETGSVSLVDFRREGLRAWPSLPRLGDVELTREPAAATPKVGAAAVERALLELVSPKLERPTSKMEATGSLFLPNSQKDSEPLASPDRKAGLEPSAVLDPPIVSEGTAVEPSKPSIWERAQESARREVETAVVASAVAEEVEEELEIDYEDAAYSDGGFSNLSVPPEERLDKERSGSEGW